MLRLRICNQQKGRAGMSNNPMNMDKKQMIRDFYRRNRFVLDDRFVLRDGKRHPFAVICPGGGYSMVCSFVEGVPLAQKLNELGISAYIVYYRVRRKAKFPNPQDDLAKAIRMVLENAERYCVEKENYSVWGASAGGHLAASFGTRNMGYAHYGLPKPGAVVLIYPVISMDPALTHQETRQNLLGKNPAAEQIRSSSVELNVTDQYPATYIWCGTADTTVTPENTHRMVAALNKEGVPCCCEIFPDVEHGVGLGIGTAAEGWLEKAVAFWRGQK